MKLQFDKDDKAGLYVTVIIHLAVIAVLLVSQINSTVRNETSFLLDFSDIEEMERLEKEAEFKEKISERLEEMLNAPSDNSGRQEIRNIAVDAGSQLKDDRNTDAEKLYEDARRLERELKNGIVPESDDDYAALNETGQKDDEIQEKQYSGPSVVSYTLDGRKAVNLKIPAYRCMGGGDVTVVITVGKNGSVLNAKVMEDISSTDQCLRNYAVRAARLSRFTASDSAPARQVGEIVYRFIAQ